jgi:hypothetical protein
VSAFRQVTVSPALIVTFRGLNPVAVIATLTVALGSEVALDAPASASTAMQRIKTFFM